MTAWLRYTHAQSNKMLVLKLTVCILDDMLVSVLLWFKSHSHRYEYVVHLNVYSLCFVISTAISVCCSSVWGFCVQWCWSVLCDCHYPLLQEGMKMPSYCKFFLVILAYSFYYRVWWNISTLLTEQLLIHMSNIWIYVISCVCTK